MITPLHCSNDTEAAAFKMRRTRSRVLHAAPRRGNRKNAARLRGKELLLPFWGFERTPSLPVLINSKRDNLLISTNFTFQVPDTSDVPNNQEVDDMMTPDVPNSEGKIEGSR